MHLTNHEDKEALEIAQSFVTTTWWRSTGAWIQGAPYYRGIRRGSSYKQDSCCPDNGTGARRTFTNLRAPSSGVDAGGGFKESLSDVELRLHPSLNNCTYVPQWSEKEVSLDAWREQHVHSMAVWKNSLLQNNLRFAVSMAWVVFVKAEDKPAWQSIKPKRLFLKAWQRLRLDLLDFRLSAKQASLSFSPLFHLHWEDLSYAFPIMTSWKQVTHRFLSQAHWWRQSNLVPGWVNYASNLTLA